MPLDRLRAMPLRGRIMEEHFGEAHWEYKTKIPRWAEKSQPRFFQKNFVHSLNEVLSFGMMFVY